MPSRGGRSWARRCSCRCSGLAGTAGTPLSERRPSSHSPRSPPAGNCRTDRDHSAVRSLTTTVTTISPSGYSNTNQQIRYEQTEGTNEQTINGKTHRWWIAAGRLPCQGRAALRTSGGSVCEPRAVPAPCPPCRTASPSPCHSTSRKAAEGLLRCGRRAGDDAWTADDAAVMAPAQFLQSSPPPLYPSHCCSYYSYYSY